MAESEKPSESQARRVLTPLLGYQMMRVETGRTPTPDYRIVEPPISIEVKELTSEDHRSVRGATRTTSFSQSPLLSGLWTYLVLTPSVSEALEGTDFTDRPRGRALESQLIKQLEVLERHNIDDYRNLPSDAAFPEAYRACLHIGWLLRGGECSRMSSIPEGLGAGVLPIGIGLGHVRDGDPNTIVALVRLWLEMKSDNMRRSLGDEPGERHGVLVADLTVGEVHTADELGIDYLPTEPLELPEQLDTIWVLLGPIWLRYNKTDGIWTVGKIVPTPVMGESGDPEDFKVR